jgi:hypothetical protein
MVKTEKNMALRQTLNRAKTPARIFAELVHHSEETLKQVAVCIANRIATFSTYRIMLVDLLRRFEGFPHLTNETDMLLCKSRLANHLKMRVIKRREDTPEHWQQRTDREVLRAFDCFYYIVRRDADYRAYFDRFMQHATDAYGAAESKRQLLRARVQKYDFGDNGPSLERTQQYNAFRAGRSKTNFTRFAYTDFLDLLRERF